TAAVSSGSFAEAGNGMSGRPPPIPRRLRIARRAVASAPRIPHPEKETTMNIRIGRPPDSWGVWFPSDPKQIPWARFLDEIAEAGYEWTELGPYGYLPTDPTTLRAELDRRGLKASAAVTISHLEDAAAWPDLEKQLLGGGELVAGLGGRFLVFIDD